MPKQPQDHLQKQEKKDDDAGEQTPTPAVNSGPSSKDPTEAPEWLAARLERAKDAGRKEAEQAALKKSDPDKALEATIEELRNELSSLRNDLGDSNLATIRVRVAAAKSVPEAYVTGTTEAEMTTAADKFIKDAAALNAAAEPEKKQKRVGYVPAQGTGEKGGIVSGYEAGQQRARDRFKKTS